MRSAPSESPGSGRPSAVERLVSTAIQLSIPRIVYRRNDENTKRRNDGAARPHQRLRNRRESLTCAAGVSTTTHHCTDGGVPQVTLDGFVPSWSRQCSS